MPTIIAFYSSLSMLRPVPGRSEREHTYHSLAVKGISNFLDSLATAGKLEHIALMPFGATSADLKIDFTRDYDQIRQAAKNSDCGFGFGSTSINAFIEAYAGKESEPEFSWVKTLATYNLNFICLGVHSDYYFTRGLAVHQELLDVASLKGQLFTTKATKSVDGSDSGNNINATTNPTQHVNHKSELGRTAVFELIERLCESSYKATEVFLKCGDYFRLESPVLLWLATTPYEQPAAFGGEPILRHINQRIEICGYLDLSDIGSPATHSRHWVLPKVEREKSSRRSGGMAPASRPAKPPLDTSHPNYEMEKLEQDIKDFFVRDPNTSQHHSQSSKKKPFVCCCMVL